MKPGTFEITLEPCGDYLAPTFSEAGRGASFSLPA